MTQTFTEVFKNHSNDADCDDFLISSQKYQLLYLKTTLECSLTPHLQVLEYFRGRKKITMSNPYIFE